VRSSECQPIAAILRPRRNLRRTHAGPRFRADLVLAGALFFASWIGLHAAGVEVVASASQDPNESDLQNEDCDDADNRQRLTRISK
jgi:hypothetical protein